MAYTGINFKTMIKKEKPLEEKKITTLTKELRKETQKMRTIKEKIPKVMGKQKVELQEYVEALEEKLMWIVDAMTKHKIDRANLAQLSKAFRVLSDKVVKARGGQIQRIDRRNVNIDIKVKNMSEKRLVDLLNEKSKHYGKDEEE